MGLYFKIIKLFLKLDISNIVDWGFVFFIINIF